MNRCQAILEGEQLVAPIAKRFARDNHHDIDDLQQEGTLAVIRAVDCGHHEPAYLKTAIRNALIDFSYRKRVPTVSLSDEIAEDLTIHDVVPDLTTNPEQEAANRELIENLTATAKAIVRLRSDGFTVREIADALSISTKTVISTLRTLSEGKGRKQMEKD